MLNTDNSTLVKIPDEIMKIPASKEWALKIDEFLNLSRLDKERPIFFIAGEYINGKLVPFDDEGLTQDSLLEAYHKLLNTDSLGNLGLYVAQDVDLDNIYLN